MEDFYIPTPERRMAGTQHASLLSLSVDTPREKSSMKRDLFNPKTLEQDKQMDMAKNVSRLKTKQAKQQRVTLLCKSLISMIRSK